MSIINDTLKSLEAKRQQSASFGLGAQQDGSQPTGEYAKASTHKESSLQTYLWAGIAVGVCALVAVAWGIVHQAHASKPHQIAVLETVAPKQVLVPKVAEAHNKEQAKQAPKQALEASKPMESLPALQGVAHKPLPAPVLTIEQKATDLSEAVDAHDTARFKALVGHISQSKHQRQELAKVLTQLEEKSHFVAAEHVLAAFRRDHPSDLSLRLEQAHLYLHEGSTKKAVGFLKSIHPHIQEHANYYALLAYAYLKEKHYKDAVSLYQQLVSIDGSEATWWMGLGIAYLALEKPHDALESFEQASTHTEAHAPYRYFISQKIQLLSGNQA